MKINDLYNKNKKTFVSYTKTSVLNLYSKLTKHIKVLRYMHKYLLTVY